MSPHNSLSWGFFDLEGNKWQNIDCEQFPKHLLPCIKNVGCSISNKINLIGRDRSLDASLYVSLGDLQCSVYSCLEAENDCGKCMYF